MSRWLVLALAIAACGKPTDEASGSPKASALPAERTAPGDGAANQAPAPRGPEPLVVFQAASEVRVPVEVVRTRREIERGMMYRQHLAPERGMLFLMEEERVHSFWMKNCLIPLDMIFVTGDMVVAGVVENAEPMTETSRTIGKPSRYVIEVNGGFARENQITAGTPVTFEHLPGS